MENEPSPAPFADLARCLWNDERFRERIFRSIQLRLQDSYPSRCADGNEFHNWAVKLASGRLDRPSKKLNLTAPSKGGGAWPPDWIMSRVPEPVRSAFKSNAVLAQCPDFGPPVESLHTFFFEDASALGFVKLEVIQLCKTAQGYGCLQKLHAATDGSRNIPSHVYFCDPYGAVFDWRKEESETRVKCAPGNIIVVAAAYAGGMFPCKCDRNYRDWFAVEVGTFTAGGKRGIDYHFSVAFRGRDLSLVEAAEFLPWERRTIAREATLKPIPPSIETALRQTSAQAANDFGDANAAKTFRRLSCKRLDSKDWLRDYGSRQMTNKAYVIDASIAK